MKTQTPIQTNIRIKPVNPLPLTVEGVVLATDNGGIRKQVRLTLVNELKPSDFIYAGAFFTPTRPTIFDLADEINREAKEAVHTLLGVFFRANRALLETVYLTKTRNQDLHYSIVLKDDTDENRSTIFRILDEPDIEAHSSNYPVYFQFYPQHLKGKIQAELTINL